MTHFFSCARRVFGRAAVLAAGAWLGAATPAVAQQRWGFEFASRPAVVVGADTLLNPWAGGFGAVAFSKMDFDRDGTPDLLAWDGRTQRPLTFVARNQRWVYAPAYEAAFPAPDANRTATFALLRDYDADGLPDLFVNANQYLRLYRQELTPGVGLGFRFVRVSAPYLQTEPAPQPQPLFSLETAPWTFADIADLDGDNDLDILHWEYNAPTHLLLERNNAGPGALPVFREDPAWGGITWCGGRSQSYAFAASGTACRPAGPLHGGNPAATVSAIDLDLDGDRDLVIGQEYVADVAGILNQGTAAQAQFTASSLATPLFGGTANPAQLLHAAAAFGEDVTFDGQPDLLLSPWLVIPTPFITDDLFDAHQSAHLYVRGANGLTYQQPDFLQSGMIDWGENAAPTLGDLDGDGDLDLLVGNAGDYEPNPNHQPTPRAYRAQIRFYRNVGTPQRAIFQLADPDFNRFSTLNRRALVPVLTDLDGNGTADLALRFSRDALGVGSPAMTFFLNTAAPGQLATYPLSDERTFQFQINRMGDADLLCFHDVDGDGDRDILLGTNQTVAGVTSPSALHFVRNQGGPPESAYVLADADFGRLPIAQRSLNGWAPAVADFDGDGQFELLAGTADGELRLWPQLLQHPTDSATFVGNLVRNDITTVFGAANVGQKPVLTTGDLDGDGRAEVLVGTTAGGVRLLRYQPNGIVGLPAAAAPAPRLAVFPNPAASTLTVTWPGAAPAATAELLDLLGRRVRSEAGTAGTARFDVTGLPAGVYTVRVQPAQGPALHSRVVVQPGF